MTPAERAKKQYLTGCAIKPKHKSKSINQTKTFQIWDTKENLIGFIDLHTEMPKQIIIREQTYELKNPTFQTDIKADIEFVSYDGKYPNRCCGTLIMRLNGRKVIFPPNCLSSGGSCGIDSNGYEYYTQAPWTITEWPHNWPNRLKERTLKIINENIPHGCCGGCI